MILLFKQLSKSSKLIFIFFLSLIAFSIINPFSILEIKNATIPFDDSVYNEDRLWNRQKKKDIDNNQYKISRYSFINSTNNEKLYLAKFMNPRIKSFYCKENQAAYIDEETNDIKCIDKTNISNPNIHPVSYLSSSGENFHILGTIPSNPQNGNDRITYLSNSLFQTLTMSLLSMITFIFFGIITSLNIAYFNNFFTPASKLLIKTLQCVPILLWMLITIIVIGYAKNIDIVTRTYIYFIFFGFFSSPALANLIIEKINYLKSKDFIVALKLLGLSDYRIITAHMYQYCKPIIVFQAAYIVAHTFFLDITLCYVETMTNDTRTFGYYISESYKQNRLDDTYLLIFLSFTLTYLFYDIATTYKIISNEE